MKKIIVILFGAAITHFSPLVHADMCDSPGKFVGDMDDPWVPNYGFAPTIQSVKDGAWESAATWDKGTVPGPNDVVRINNAVILNSQAQAKSVTVYSMGLLSFSPVANTQLTLDTLQLICGELDMGTVGNPIPPNHTAQIIFTDTPIDTTFDPGQYGHGLMSMDGTVSIQGAPLNPTFVRVTKEPLQGQTSLSLEQAVSGWNVNDRVVLAGTRQFDWFERFPNPTPDYPNFKEWEEFTIQSISSDGKTVNLSKPLAFDHKGAREVDGTLTFLPHVANYSRNVSLRSANPDGTRGHVFFMGRSNVDIRYAAFRDLGRTLNQDLDNTTFNADGTASHVGTNQIARYPLHLHHVNGPVTPQANGYQFTLIGNAIDGGSASRNFKWGLVMHDSHFGLVQDNVLFNMKGAGIVGESGSEYHDVVDHNFVCWVDGLGGRADHQNADVSGIGFIGDCYYFDGPFCPITNNVAANCGLKNGPYGYGFTISMNIIFTASIPPSQGADMSLYQTVDIQSYPLEKFENNEVYGSQSGGTFWWVRTQETDPQPLLGTHESVIKNLTVWNSYLYGIFMYASYNTTIDGLKVRGDWKLLSGGNGMDSGVVNSDYPEINVDIRNADIQAVRNGYTFSANSGGGIQTVENSIFRTVTGLFEGRVWSVSDDNRGLLPRTVYIKNDQFLPTPQGYAPQSYPVAALSMNSFGDPPYTNLDKGNYIVKDQALIYAYNGDPTKNYQAFFTTQRANHIFPQSLPGYAGLPNVRIVACPDAGLTNAQCLAKYGVTDGGAISPCQDDTCTNALSIPEISADVFPIPQTDSVPPAVPVGLVAVAGNTQVFLSWTANKEPDLSGYNIYRSGSSNGTFTKLNFASVSSPSYIDSALTNGTAYWYKISAVDNSGNESAQSTAVSATPTIVADTTPPVLSNILAGSISQTGTVITWSTNEPADSQVEFGLSINYGNPSTLNSQLAMPHSVTLSGLTPGMLYHYCVKSKDAAGNLAVSPDQTFATMSVGSAAPISSAPSVSLPDIVADLNNRTISPSFPASHIEIFTRHGKKIKDFTGPGGLDNVKGLAAGLYFYALSGGNSQMGKLAVAK